MTTLTLVNRNPCSGSSEHGQPGSRYDWIMNRAAQIRHERQRRGMTQRQTAELGRIALRTYSRFESGQRVMSEAVYALLCRELGLKEREKG